MLVKNWHKAEENHNKKRLRCFYWNNDLCNFAEVGDGDVTINLTRTR
jgi:hypothetical protein